MKKYSLYVKFNVLIVGAIFICGVLIGSLMLYTTRTQMERELDTAGLEIGQALSTAVGDDILLDDRFSITEQLVHIQTVNSQIRYIMVTLPNGHIIASTFTDGLPQGLPPVRQRRPDKKTDTMLFDSNEGMIREVLYPIDDGLIGYFRIGLTEGPMSELMRRRFAEIITLVLLICLAASWLATRFAHSFLKPIRTMSLAVRQLGRGNYCVKVEPQADDDMGRLARAFNTLSSRLYARDQENSRLLQTLQEKERLRMQLISQLFSAREDERRRISRELHDETSQSMVSMLAYLRIIRDRIPDASVRELVENVSTLTKETLEGLRHLAVNLHPPLLDDLGLVAAMEKYLDTFRRAQPQIEVTFVHDGDCTDLPRPVSLLCYRMMQEGLTNIVRHARATAAHISLAATDRTLTLTITDNGIGLSRDMAEKARLDNHLGLASMQERTELLSGTFQISSLPQGGTAICITLPLKDVSLQGGTDHAN